MNTILDVQHVQVSYGDEQILEDVSFSVNKGDVVIILGPNGSGKTTLLRALLGIVPHKGSVTWQTKKIGYVPPKELINRTNLPPLSLYEFFSFKKVTDAQIKASFDAVGLDHRLLERQFGALSTGQFQRMLIAWAIVDEPDVLLFDEPTLGIDIGGQETLYTLLHRLWKERSLTILLITHEMDIVWEHASKVLCLNKKIVCYGSPENALTPENMKRLYGAGVSLYEHRHSS